MGIGEKAADGSGDIQFKRELYKMMGRHGRCCLILPGGGALEDTFLEQLVLLSVQGGKAGRWSFQVEGTVFAKSWR